MLQGPENPHGNPGSGFDDIAMGIQENPAAFFRHTFLPPFYSVGGPTPRATAPSKPRWTPP